MRHASHMFGATMGDCMGGDKLSTGIGGGGICGCCICGGGGGGGGDLTGKYIVPLIGTAPRGTWSCCSTGGRMLSGERTGVSGGVSERYGSGCLYGHSGPLLQFGHARQGVCSATMKTPIY